MNKIEIRTQEEFDALPETYTDAVEIRITGKINVISRTPVNCALIVCGTAYVHVVCGASSIQTVCDLARINVLCGSAQIKNVEGKARINVVCDFAKINEMGGSATVGVLCDCARINLPWNLGLVRLVTDSASTIYTG